MSDLVESEAASNPAYRRFRSEYRGKRWLYQKLLRDSHGHLKQPALISTEDSPLPYKEQRLLELKQRRETQRKEQLERNAAIRLEQEKCRKEIEDETVNYLLKNMKNVSPLQKGKREKVLKQECAEQSRKKGSKAVWAETQPLQLLRFLQLSLSS